MGQYRYLVLGLSLFSILLVIGLGVVSPIPQAEGAAHEPTSSYVGVALPPTNCVGTDPNNLPAGCPIPDPVPIALECAADDTVLLVQDNVPWSTNTDPLGANVETLVFQGIDFCMINSTDLSATNFSQFRLIIISGAQGQTFLDNLMEDQNVVDLEAWITTGGILSASLADFTSGPSGVADWHGSSFVGGLTHVHTSSNNNNIVATTHPIILGTFGGIRGGAIVDTATFIDLDGWGSSDHGYFDTVPAGTTTILNSANGPVMIEFSLGDGTVIATMTTIEWRYVGNFGALPTNFKLLDNEIGYQNGLATWFDTDWDFRKLISIDNTKVAEDLTDFPVLISITDADLAQAQADGKDILFTTIGGTQLSHEIDEDFDQGTGTIVDWLRIPNLFSIVDTRFYMYYGNSDMSLNVEDSTGVWTSNYRFVHHLNEAGTSGVLGEYKDSTSFGNDGQGGAGTASRVPSLVSGQIGGAQDFVRIQDAGDFIDLKNAASITTDIDDTTGHTVEAWVLLSPDFVGEQQGIISQSFGKPQLLLSDTARGPQPTPIGGGNDFAELSFAATDGSFPRVFGAQSLKDNQWHFMVGTWDNTLLKIYVDGVLEGTLTPSKTPKQTTCNFTLGMTFTQPCQELKPPAAPVSLPAFDNQEYDGRIDEARLSAAVYSSGFILTEYNNQNSPGTFYTVGAQQVVPNTPPVNSVPGAQETDEDNDLTFSSGNGNLISISDVDSTSAQVKLTATNGVLTLSGIAGLTFSAGADGTATMTFTGTFAAINTALAGMSFSPTPDFNGAASLTILTDDQEPGSTDEDTVNITVNAVNDAPVNTVPGTQTTDEDTDKVINGISIADVDANESPQNDVQVTLTATSNVTLAQTTDLDFTVGDGTDDTTMTFNGTITNINLALNGLTYTPTANLNGVGAGEVEITTNDKGHTGSGGAKSDTDAVTININAVNDAPENTVPGAQTTDEDTAKVISGISILDVDSTTAKVTLSVTQGTITIGTTGLAFTLGDGTADVSMTFTGTIAAINTAISGLSYLPNQDYNGPDTLTITADDQGNTGSGGAKTDTDNIAITVTPVNDPPVAVDDTAITDVDSDIPIDVLANDLDVDNVNADLAVAAVETQGVLLNTIVNPNPSLGDLFSRGLAFEGDRFVVGAPLEDIVLPDTTVATDAGVVYVYDSEGILLHTLQKATPVSGDEFGWSVDKSGDLVVVGARLDDNGATDAGAAYVFNLTDCGLPADPCSPLLTLARSSPVTEDEFGYDVAIFFDRVVVGARNVDVDPGLDSTTNEGAANVFDFTLCNDDNGVCNNGIEIANPSSGAGDQFGLTVEMFLFDVFVGAPFAELVLPDTTVSADQGIVYRFSALTGGPPNLTFQIQTATEGFGSAIDVDGDLSSGLVKLIVGAPGDDTGGTDAGIALFFNVADCDAADGNSDGTCKNATQSLVDPAASAGDLFGSAVAIDGDTAVVGAAFDDVNPIADSGSAHIFNALTGTHLRTVSNPEPDVDDQFGFSADLRDNRFVVGAPRDDSAEDAGEAYLYVVSTDGTVTEINVANDLTFTPSAGFFGITAFDYTVTDNIDTGSTAMVLVTVNPPPPGAEGLSPAADAGLPQTPDEQTVVTLDGTLTNDPDGDNAQLSFLWQHQVNPVSSANLVAAISFDNNELADSSDEGNSVNVLTGTQTFATVANSQIGTAFQFDGSTGLAVQSASSLDLANAITIAGWFNLPATDSSDTASQFLFRKGFFGFDPYMLRVLPDSSGSNKLRADLTLDAGNRFYTFTYTPNTWTHFAMTWSDVSNNYKFYINGVPVFAPGIDVTGPVNTNTRDLGIGGNGVGTERLQDGSKLDNLRIYNRELTSTEILVLVNNDAPQILVVDANTDGRAFSQATFTAPVVPNGSTETLKFVLAATDDDGTGTDNVSINVQPVNTPPDAVDNSYTTNEDTSTGGNVKTDDTGAGVDSDADAIDTFSVTSFDATSTEGATVSVNADGSFTYDPTGSATLQAQRTGDSIVDTFTYTITDNNGGTDTATVSVTVSGVDDFPVANAGPDNNVNALTTVNLDGSGSSHADNNEILTFNWVRTDANTGLLTPLSDPTAQNPSFIPPSVFGLFLAERTIEFKLTATDEGPIGNPDTDDDTVIIVINSVGALSADAGPLQTVDEKTATVTLDGSNSAEPNANPFTFAWQQNISIPQNNLVAELLFDDANNLSLISPVTLITSVNAGGTLTQTIGPINGAHQFDGSTALSIQNDASLNLANAITIAGWFYLPATDSSDTASQYLFRKGFAGFEPYMLRVLPDSLGANKLRADLTLDAGNRFYTFTYTPNTWTHFAMTWSDVSNNYKFYINGVPVFAPGIDVTGPVNTNTRDLGIGGNGVGTERLQDGSKLDNLRIYNQELTSAEVLDLFNNDAPQVVLTGSTTSSPTFPAPVIPNGVTRTLAFELTVQDTADPPNQDTDTTTVTVEPVNEAPLAIDDSGNTSEDSTTPITIDVLDDDSDPDDDALTITGVDTTGTQGSVTFTDSTVDFLPASNFDGQTTFTYTVDDNVPGSIDTGTVTITVAGVNDAPVAVDDPATAGGTNEVIISVLLNDVDPDQDTLSITAVSTPTLGSIVDFIVGGTTITYKANENAEGTDTFTYTATDDDLNNPLSDTATVTVTVNKIIVALNRPGLSPEYGLSEGATVTVIDQTAATSTVTVDITSQNSAEAGLLGFVLEQSPGHPGVYANSIALSFSDTISQSDPNNGVLLVNPLDSGGATDTDIVTVAYSPNPEADPTLTVLATATAQQGEEVDTTKRIGCTLGDADGDGICTESELLEDGLEINNRIDDDGDGIIDRIVTFNFPCDPVCPDPAIPDIYIEVDTLLAHDITAEEVAPIVAAYAANGKNAHIFIDEIIPQHPDNIPFPGTTAIPGFDQIKEQFFGTLAERTGPNADELLTAKRQVFRYALIVHDSSTAAGGAAGGGASGYAESPGNDMIISLGNTQDADRLAGTFMHELGHMLTLRHGGDEDINCKPNYRSVMSYSHQFSSYYNRPLDYSNGDLIALPLDETALVEDVAYGSSSLRPDALIVYGTPGSVAVKTASVGTQIDWNGVSGIESGTVTGDINNLGITDCGVSVGDTNLQDHDDWSAIDEDAYFLASTFYDGEHTELVDVPLVLAAQITLVVALNNDIQALAAGDFTSLVTPPQQARDELDNDLIGDQVPASGVNEFLEAFNQDVADEIDDLTNLNDAIAKLIEVREKMDGSQDFDSSDDLIASVAQGPLLVKIDVILTGLRDLSDAVDFHKPIVGDDEFATNKDAPIDISVSELLENDEVPFAGGTLTFTGFDDSETIGLVTLVDSTFTYDPNGKFDLVFGETAVDSFDYTVENEITSNTGTVTIIIGGTGAPILVESFWTGSGVIDSFEAIFKEDKKTKTFKLKSTTPGTIFYTTLITNIGPDPITAEIVLQIPSSDRTPDGDPPGPRVDQVFCLKGSGPMQVFSDTEGLIGVTIEAVTIPDQPIEFAKKKKDPSTCVSDVTIELPVPDRKLRLITVAFTFGGAGQTGFADDIVDVYQQDFTITQTTTVGSEIIINDVDISITGIPSED